MDRINEYLEDCYQKALKIVGNEDSMNSPLPADIETNLQSILVASDKTRAVLAVVITGIVYKIFNPHQDVRKHQKSIPGGYAGRPFDTKYITPFLKAKQFPAMSSTGWLTRSFEQKVPYDSNYTGGITPERLKLDFLKAYDDIESYPELCEDMFIHLLCGLITMRDSQNVPMARPQNLTIAEIIEILESHFNHKYSAKGASRLPVLALYAIYQTIVTQLGRYAGKELLPLAQHTTSDLRSGRLGDIDVIDQNGEAFEAVEIKAGIAITHDIVLNAKMKIQPSHAQRYYILSTAPIVDSDKEAIRRDISQIKNIHGCEIVVNGVIPTLKYYLRLLKDTSAFTDNYASLLSNDKDIAFEHRAAWNDIVANL